MSKQTPAQWNTSIASPMTGTTHEVCVVYGVPTQPTEDGLGQGYIYIGANKPCFEVDKAEQLSNAHLIAAAPEMYAFIEEICRAGGAYAELNNTNIVADAYRVLAKAEGKS